MRRARDLAPAAARSAAETRLLLVLWAATLLGATGVLILWIGLTGAQNLHYVWITALGLATVPGKLVIFSGLAPDSPLDPFGVAFLGVAVDVFLSTSLSLGLGPFRRLPGIGAWLDRANLQAAQAVALYPRLRRTAFWGAALFVSLPVPGSGWIGGTFLAQLLGLSRPAGVAAIAVGAAAIGTVFALMAEAMGAQAVTLLKSPWIAGSGLIGLGLVVWLLWRRFRSLLRSG